MPAKIKSGLWEGTARELKQTYIAAIFNGSYQGMLQAITQVNPTLAQKTGQFRTVFAVSALEHIQEQFGQSELVIDTKAIARKMAASLSYAQYHIDGKPHHPGDTSSYDEPSTSGTKPLDTDELERIAEEKITEAVRNNLKSAGLEVLLE